MRSHFFPSYFLEYQQKVKEVLNSRRDQMNELFKIKFDQPLLQEITNLPSLLMLKKLYVVNKYTIGTQITRREVGFKFRDPNHIKEYRTSDHPSLIDIPFLMINNTDKKCETEMILLRNILTDLEEEGRDLVGLITELDPLAYENKGQSSGAAGLPNPIRLQQSISGTGVISLGAHNAKTINFAKIRGKSASINYCNANGKQKEFQFGVSLKRRIYPKTKTINFHKRMQQEWKRLDIEKQSGRSWDSATTAIAAFLRKMDLIGMQYAKYFVNDSVDATTFSDSHQKLCTNVCIGNTSTINVHLDARSNFPAVMSCKKNSHGGELLLVDYCFLLKYSGKDIVLIKGDRVAHSVLPMISQPGVKPVRTSIVLFNNHVEE